MNVLKHRILSDEDVMQVIKPTHLCDIGNQIPHCILLASIKWVKLFGLWSVFYQLERRLREALLRPIICHHEIEAYQPQTSIIYYLK